MKTIRFNLTFLVLMLCTATAFSQTIRRVNNTGISLGENMYETLQAAHNAADGGDIIYVEGSGTKYGGATIEKKLTIIGPGYFLGENYNYFPDLRSANFNSNTIVFNPGSEGSVLTGCSNFYVRVNTSDITISRNNDLRVYLGYATSLPLTDILINKNYDIFIYGWTSNFGVSVLISNNYLTGTQYLYYSNYSGTFSNNIISGGFSLNNFTVSNNILISGSSVSFTNCTLSNNIDGRALTGATAFGSENGNLTNVDKTTLFLGSTGNSTDGQWKLKEGSVAIGAGSGGTDCGIYGGSDPYELSGISSFDYPSIIKMTTSGTGSDSTPLSVTISTK